MRNDKTVARFPRGNSKSVLALLEKAVLSIQPKPGLAMSRVWTVAGETVLGKDRPDIPVETDRNRRVGPRRQGTTPPTTCTPSA